MIPELKDEIIHAISQINLQLCENVIEAFNKKKDWPFGTYYFSYNNVIIDNSIVTYKILKMNSNHISYWFEQKSRNLKYPAQLHSIIHQVSATIHKAVHRQYAASDLNPAEGMIPPCLGGYLIPHLPIELKTDRRGHSHIRPSGAHSANG